MATEQTSGGFIYDPVTGTPVDVETARNAQARWLQSDAKATKAEQGSAAALGTLSAVKQEAAQANTAAQQSAASSSSSAAASSAAADTAERFGDDVELIKQMAGINPGSVTDAQTALLVQDPDSETSARVRDQIAQKFIVDSDHASLEAALSAVEPGGTLEIREAWTRSAVWAIAKPVKVRFAGGSITTSGQHVHGITVTASDVSITDPVITGAGGNLYATGCGIRVESTLGAGTPVRNFTLSGGRISEIPNMAIRMEHVNGAVLTNVSAESVGYAGFMTLSCFNVDFTACHVKTIHQAAPWTNSYGFAITRHESQSEAQSPRPRGFTLTGCTVTDHPKWEAFDTHGGEDITFTGCIATRTRIGFAMVPCPNPDKTADIFAPRNVSIIGCTVKGDPDSATQQVGIKVVGCGTTSVAGERATGVVYGNTVEDMGGNDVNAAGGILVQACDGVNIGSNQIIRPRGVGIYAYHSNDSVTLSDNTIADVWSNTLAFAAAIYLRSSGNKVKAWGNRLASRGKVATVVNDRGFYIGNTVGSEVLDLGGNDFSVAPSRIVGGTGILVTGVFEKKSVQPAVRATATTDAEVLALVNQMRTALIDYGLVR